MMSFSKMAFRASKTLSRPSTMAATRSFGAMGEMNREMFEHSFTSDMKFQDSFDKIKCFRVLDEAGEVVTPGYDTKISQDLLL